PVVTPVPSPTPVPALKPLELVIPTLAIDVVAAAVPCDTSLLSYLPKASDIVYSDCGGYTMFIAGGGGRFDSVPGSPPDTPVSWANSLGVPFHATLIAGVTTLARDPATGQYAGHGVGGPSVFLQVRTATQAQERGGVAVAG
ncbi:MAG: hypothetical protein ACREN2_13930, partial [Candidatus Dormibacteria bacterium]